jgi:hypothetical protein
VVPSLFHSAQPIALALARKKSVPFTFTKSRSLTVEDVDPGSMSAIAFVPAVVPVVFHSTQPMSL